MKKIPMFAMGMMVAALLGAGCKTQMPKASGFLSDYSHLTAANDSTWQYVDAGALASYDKVIISPVKIMSSDYWGSAFTDEQRQKLANNFQQKLTAALGKKYSVVTTAGPNTAEVRAAITRAYRVGNSLAVGVEAEIVASDSRKQLAAVSGVKVGPPEMSINTSARAVNDPSDPGTYMAGWWNRPAADELLSRWTEQIEKLINAGHGPMTK